MLEGKYNFREEEIKWEKFWQDNGVYKFDPNDKTRKTFSIDTPPPTVSGALHIGHISGFGQADMIARYHRMLGKNLFYPLGFDNNGLPTELLVEKEKKIPAHTISREEFTKIALELVASYNQMYRDMMIRCGMSCDLSLGYNTIDNKSQKTSQKSFIDLAKKGFAYREFKPAPWCTKCRTSVAGAELEDKELPSIFNYLNFKLADGSGTIPIATTRPEFLPACVAIFVNPNDERYKNLVGKEVLVPLFEETKVKILTDEKVGIDKGTGIVMCCTFGDQTDAQWWKEYNLPLKQAIDDGGRMTELCGKYAGLKTTVAREQIIEDLKTAGYLYKQEPLVHSVKVHERCDQPIEFLAKKQWFIKTSSEELRNKWIEQGDKINWFPAHMKVRYDAWVKNLNQDWNISRQRYFGVPFPVWYCKDCGEVIFADESDLPVNPLTSSPKHACPKCGSTSFEPESDVMDTWATSSVTPQINCNWAEDESGCAERMPMDMRFCGRDIITTWDLRTIIKAYYHQGTTPWKNLIINGWVMADKGVKISKHLANSKMNLSDLVNNFGADVIRYWCANGAYGRDVLFTDDGIKDGLKLLNKIWNASKFVLSFLEDYEPKKPAKVLKLDSYIMSKFNKMFDRATDFYNKVEMGYAKEEIEKFFWDFCDNYIELVKNRLYKPEIFGQEAKESAQWACYNVLYRFLQLIGITMPHIAEEIYQAYFVKFEKEISIHRTTLAKVPCDDESENLISCGEELCALLAMVRGWKSQNNLSLKEEIENITIYSTNPDGVKEMITDFLYAGGIKNYVVEKADEAKIEVK